MTTAKELETTAGLGAADKVREGQRLHSRFLEVIGLSGELPKPKGWFRKRCPVCNERVSRYHWENLQLDQTLYECECGYAYGVERVVTIG